MSTIKHPRAGTSVAQAIKALKASGVPMRSADVAEMIGGAVNPVAACSCAYRAYPHLVRRVKKGWYQYAGPSEKGLIDSRPESNVFVVPVLAVIKGAKRDRPIIRNVQDHELVQYHIVSNRNVFKRGVDYTGENPVELKLTYRAALKLATMLGSHDTRAEIESSKAKVDGKDHVKDFDMSLLTPEGGPEGFPVSFDALMKALGLNRIHAMRRIKTPFLLENTRKSVENSTGGRPRDCYWMTEVGAKRFVYDCGIATQRKDQLVEYFIRREMEAQDYIARDQREKHTGSLIHQPPQSAELATAIAGMAQAVTAMISQQNQMTALIAQIVARQDSQDSRLTDTLALTDGRVKAAEERADEAYHGRTRRIETYQASYPITSNRAASAVGLYTSSGKPHFQAVRAVAEALHLFDHGLAMFDDESGEHRFVRLNSGAVEVMKEWRRDCIDSGAVSCEFPRSQSSVWTIHFYRGPSDEVMN